MTEADFDAKPMVLVVGQYSVGKTSFIQSLLQTEFTGSRIGPEPTTDKCVRACMSNITAFCKLHALQHGSNSY